MQKKIRVGIELNHVIRDINRQIAKYYQKDFDESIDLDEIDYKDDVLNTICKFKTKRDKLRFLYEEYPLEIFGHANQVDRTLFRDLNKWMIELTNQEEYDVEIFFYSMDELALTIQSTYFFLSKGSQVRKVIFPKSIEELMTYGDVFITANKDVVSHLMENYFFEVKRPILINMNFNSDIKEKYPYLYKEYNDFKSFLNDNNKLNVIAENISGCEENKQSWFTTWMSSWISSLRKKIGV